MKTKKSARVLAGQMYQVVGNLDPSDIDEKYVFDQREYIRLLDYLSEIANGETDVNDDFLPFSPWVSIESLLGDSDDRRNP